MNLKWITGIQEIFGALGLRMLIEQFAHRIYKLTVEMWIKVRYRAV